MNATPAISDVLREVTKNFHTDPVFMTRNIYRALIKLEGYKDLAPDLQEDLQDSLIYTARLWFASLLEGEYLSDSSKKQLEEMGRRRVHQGVPLHAITRAFSLGVREIWLAYLTASREDKHLEEELLYNISEYLFNFFEAITEEVVTAYLDEQIKQVRWKENLYQRLFHILTTVSKDGESFKNILLTLGLDPGAPRVALALDIGFNSEQSMLRESELDHLTLTIARKLKLKAHELVRLWHRGRFLIWIPRPPGETISQCDQYITQSARDLIDILPKVNGIGIGIMNIGLDGWRSSADEALRSIDFYFSKGTQKKIASYSRLIIEDSLRGNENSLRYLSSLLQQLTHEPELLYTLEMYFSEGRHRVNTAKQLSIHTNTLNYRLGRVEGILNADLNDLTWLATLDAALKLRQQHAQ